MDRADQGETQAGGGRGHHRGDALSWPRRARHHPDQRDRRQARGTTCGSASGRAAELHRFCCRRASQYPAIGGGQGTFKIPAKPKSSRRNQNQGNERLWFGRRLGVICWEKAHATSDEADAKVGSIAGTRPRQGISPKLCSRCVLALSPSAVASDEASEKANVKALSNCTRRFPLLSRLRVSSARHAESLGWARQPKASAKAL